MIITSLWLVDVLLLFITTTLLLYKYTARNYNYWKKKGIYYKKPIPFFGNAYDVMTFKIGIGEWLRDVYNSTNDPYLGIYVLDKPYLVLKSPELIKQILVKDFNYFSDRTVLAPKHNKVIANMLFVQKNPDWKIERPKLTPLFSSGKLKSMFHLIHETGLEMSRYIRNNNLVYLESKEVCAKYATDVIAKCAFGINSHCFEEEDAEFRKIGRSFFDFTWKNAISQTMYFFYQDIASFFHMDFLERWAVKYLKDVFLDTIKLRENNNVKGNDLIDIVIEIRKNKQLCKELKFEGDKVVAHAIQFFAAGFETTSSTIAFTLYELCIQPDLQDRLRKEILSNIKKYNGITYEGLQEMKYMDMCVMETLRKYPVLPFLDRTCMSDYKVPGTDFIIDQGTSVYVPMLGIHYDEKYYPEPYKYNPDRFADKSEYNQKGLNYLPFGEGPRNCIGERFGLLGTKVGLVSILSEFELERTPETPVPLIFEPKSFILASKVGLPMKFKEFNNPTPS